MKYADHDLFCQKVSSLTLFVTHYPSLAELQVIFPSQVSNNHMAFMTSQEEHQEGEQSAKDSAEEETGTVPSVTFLYHLVNGAAARSYGLNVARLAGIPRDILNMAAEKSHELENAILSRRYVVNCVKRLTLLPLPEEKCWELFLRVLRSTPLLCHRGGWEGADNESLTSQNGENNRRQYVSRVKEHSHLDVT